MRRRTVLSAAALLLLLPVLAAADVEKFKVDPAHTEVGFTVRHFVSKVPGHFNTVEGEVLIDPKDPSTMKITGKIDAKSINTNNEKRDTHLRSDAFFDVANHPDITFVSKKVVKNGDKWTVTGDLTIRGVTKEVPLEVEILGFMPDPWGNQRTGIEAHGTVNRQDFGVSWNKKLDQGGMMLGDDVELVLHVEAVKEAPQQAQK